MQHVQVVIEVVHLTVYVIMGTMIMEWLHHVLHVIIVVKLVLIHLLVKVVILTLIKEHLVHLLHIVYVL